MRVRIEREKDIESENRGRKRWRVRIEREKEIESKRLKIRD